MTKSERITELQKLRAFLGTADFREIQHRRDAVAKIAALLAYNIHHKSSAEYHGSILSRPKMSSLNYDSAHGELDRLVGQAIAELEISDDTNSDIAPHAPLITISRKTQPASAVVVPGSLASDHGPLWFWHHCHYRVKWSLLTWAAGASLTLLTAGFAAGRTNLFIRLFDVFQDTSATAPAQKPIQENTAPTTNASDTTIMK